MRRLLRFVLDVVLADEELERVMVGVMEMPAPASAVRESVWKSLCVPPVNWLGRSCCVREYVRTRIFQKGSVVRRTVVVSMVVSSTVGLELVCCCESMSAVSVTSGAGCQVRIMLRDLCRAGANVPFQPICVNVLLLCSGSRR